MAEILFKELSYAVVGAAMEVHRTLGAGFLETVYRAALAYELTLRGIPFEEQVHLPVYYKGQLIGEYIADLVIDGKIIIELKAITEIHDAHRAQAINYLAATGFELAIILNFGGSKLQQERLVRFKSFEKK
ncbi:MAG: GxxExxY protein [Anaerolineales bacterium]|nr:GxxExxY protein [Anaerolineales bacterium]